MRPLFSVRFARHALLIKAAVALFVLNFLLLNSTQAQIVDRILAIVSDEPVTQSDLNSLSKKLRGNELIDESLLETYEKKSLISDNKQLLNFLIDEKILDSEIIRLGLAVPIEQVEAKIREIAKMSRVEVGQLRATLKSKGIAYSDYQEFIRTSLQRQGLIQKEVTSKIKISDEDVHSFYIQAYSSAKSLSYEYSLAHIIFLSKSGGAEAAKKKAHDVLEKIRSGAVSFEQAATQFSEDPDFTQGGLFGKFRLSDMNPSLAGTIAPLGGAEVSGLVTFPDGFRLFKVLQKNLVPSPDLEAKKEEIRSRLMAQQFRKQFRSWLDFKRKELYVLIN